MGKEKTPAQSLETKSSGALAVVLSDWVIHKHDQDDFGIDFSVRPTRNGEQLPTEIDIQLKASESYDGEAEVSQRIDTDALEDYMRSRKPVYLMVYEQESGEIYWELIQEYIWREYGRDPENWENQSTVTIRLDRTPLKGNRKQLIENAQNAEKPIFQYVLEVSLMDSMHGRMLWTEVRQALESGKSGSIEFMGEFIDDNIAPTATGMANADGGFLVFGVTEDKYGLDLTLSDAKDADHYISRVKRKLNRIQPAVDAEISAERIGENLVVVADISAYPGSGLPHAVDGTFYIRSGMQTQSMAPQDLERYFT